MKHADRWIENGCKTQEDSANFFLEVCRKKTQDVETLIRIVKGDCYAA